MQIYNLFGKYKNILPNKLHFALSYNHKHMVPTHQKVKTMVLCKGIFIEFCSQPLMDEAKLGNNSIEGLSSCGIRTGYLFNDNFF